MTTSQTPKTPHTTQKSAHSTKDGGSGTVRNKDIATDLPIPTKQLGESVDKLTDIIRSRTSRHRTLLNGIMTGVGTVIGATIVAGLGILALTRILQHLDFIPGIDTVLEQVQQADPNE